MSDSQSYQSFVYRRLYSNTSFAGASESQIVAYCLYDNKDPYRPATLPWITFLAAHPTSTLLLLAGVKQTPHPYTKHFHHSSGSENWYTRLIQSGQRPG